MAGSGGKRGTQKWNRDEENDTAAADRKAARARSLEVFQNHRQRHWYAGTGKFLLRSLEFFLEHFVKS